VRGLRFTDKSDQTVTDNLTGLQWGKKGNVDRTPNGSDPHDADNVYRWSHSGTAADGDVFQTLLVDLNAPTCFAAQCDWRLPTIAELQTIETDFGCTGAGLGPRCSCPPSSPCVDPALGPTQSNHYWSATTNVGSPDFAWTVLFYGGDVDPFGKTTDFYGRAVRGGW